MTDLARITSMDRRGFVKALGGGVLVLVSAPGLANGLANLHNARRAQTPIVNAVGDQATYHRPNDAPLTADTEGWARGASAWVRTAASSATVGADAAVAVQAARTHPGQIATLILPSDTSWDEGGIIADALPVPPKPPSDPAQIANAANILRRGAPTLIVLGGEAVRAEALESAHRIAAATGARLITQGANARISRGRGRVPVDRIPYVVEAGVKALAGTRHVILCGLRKPVTFFAYPNKPTTPIPPDADIHILARPDQDAAEALARLADELSAPRVAIPDPGPRPDPARGKLTPDSVAATLSALLPENAVITDEAVTFGRGFFPLTHAAPPHDWLNSTGGAIGCGPPLAQRLLWASTSTKNPAYPDVKYVEPLIGPNTVNTLPVETLEAYRDHGNPAARLMEDLDRAASYLQRLPEVGIDLNQATQQLEDEGVEKFNQPFDSLMCTLEGKRREAMSHE